MTTYTYTGVHVTYMYTYGIPDEWCTRMVCRDHVHE
jgi:hypothetical protein